ncbi:dihydrolipoyl dehydrogenase family protein [Dictyobacter aurantiacus]|uniref:Mercuric reductase n=1 Tax=Dictyobacter aurantiacus TaxID=1936993 RepID=A0A401Z879_9CHLR|nr:NAD(P)/FAD-dependent oxidoreductase [Dictyobacter aurantiacus]GCE03045.1 mercuric reductase [Dictyobacter aurantiacus]
MNYDLTIIGGGSAGLTAARIAHSLGARVLLIDKERLGGDCLHYGCVPSKSLIHVADLVMQARQVARFGVQGGQGQIDMEKVGQYIQEVIGRVAANEQADIEGVDIAFGKVTFQSPGVLRLNDKNITSRYTLIATGSRPAIPALPGLAEIGFLTNETVFDLTRLPSSLIVLGGGPVGVEMAQALARLGTRVTIVQRAPQLLPREEPEIAETLADLLRADGITIYTKAQALQISQHDGQKRLSIQQDEQTLLLEAEEVLVATGRRPNVAGLELASIGLHHTERGIVVNDYLQTNLPHIFALGDVLGDLFFTHVAAYQAGVAVRNALLPIGKQKVDYRVLPWCTFTRPQVAHIGLTHAQAQGQYKHVRAVTFPWREIDRAQTEHEQAGFIKLILKGRKEEIVGAHLIGSQAGELLGELSLAMKHHLTISHIYNTIHPYPTYSTGLQQATFHAYLLGSTVNTNRKLIQTILRMKK